LPCYIRQCMVYLHSRCKQEEMKIEETECSETSVHKIQMPENHPKERIQHSEHGESLKSRIDMLLVSRCSARRPISNFYNKLILLHICCYQIFVNFSLLPCYIRQLLISRSSSHCLLHLSTTFHSTGLQSQAIFG